MAKKNGTGKNGTGRMDAAAFFDLDRTLIASSSAPVFQRHIVAAGIAPDRSIPFADLFLKQYEVFGENWLLMQPAKLAAQAAKGWNKAAVKAAAESAAVELEGMLQPFAHHVFAEHREAGRKLVLATTSPHAFVKPLAKRLGFDGVISTKWKARDGVYTGKTKGEFVWGQEKARAIARWAEKHDVDLDESYGYSDSVYDAPMLGLVGHPVAVNPDAHLAAMALVRRWPIRHLDKSEGVVKIGPLEAQEWARPLIKPELFWGYAQFEMLNLDHVPTEGPAIIAFNHRSYFDPAVVALAMAEVGRPIRALAKKELFDTPVLGQLLRSIGTIEVDRGSGSSNPLDQAMKALDAGEVVMIAPQGTIPRGPAFFEPQIEVRKGVVSLAHETRAPVIPLGIWGTEKVWPRSAKMPKISLGDRPLVTARAGAPVDLKYRSIKADAARIAEAMMNVLPSEAAEPYEPTEAELVASYPAGKAPAE